MLGSWSDRVVVYGERGSGEGTGGGTRRGLVRRGPSLHSRSNVINISAIVCCYRCKKGSIELSDPTAPLLIPTAENIRRLQETKMNPTKWYTAKETYVQKPLRPACLERRFLADSNFVNRQRKCNAHHAVVWYHNAFQKTKQSFYSSNLPPTKAQLEASSLPLRYSYTVNVTAWPGATRITRGVIPL